jgi:hypothetical protein
MSGVFLIAKHVCIKYLIQRPIFFSIIKKISDVIRFKCLEAYHRLKWWYDYFLIGDALTKVKDIVMDKLLDLGKTALQYEEL